MLQTRLSSRREEGLQSSRVSQTERRLVSAIRGVWLSACGKGRRTRGGRVTPFPRLQEPSGVSAATSPMTTASCNGVQVMIVLPFEWQPSPPNGRCLSRAGHFVGSVVATAARSQPTILRQLLPDPNCPPRQRLPDHPVRSSGGHRHGDPLRVASVLHAGACVALRVRRAAAWLAPWPALRPSAPTSASAFQRFPQHACSCFVDPCNQKWHGAQGGARSACPIMDASG